MISRKQAEYHARRAYDKEYRKKLHDPGGPGRASELEDAAQYSANLAYEAKLKEHGYK
jgi:hypothetical protein